MNQKIILLSLIIFAVTLAVLGIPFQEWGFKTDDFSNIYATQQLCPQGLKKVFSTGNIEALCYPSNYPIHQLKQSFLSGLYRPFSFLLYYPQYLLFKTKPYGYFLTTVALHALNSSLLFIILAYFFSLSSAFALALLFAFHPSLANWLGWVSAQTYFSELFFLLLTIIFFKNYLNYFRYRWYLLSLCCYFIILFTKETTIVLPCIMTVGLLLFRQRLQLSLSQVFKSISGYWLVVIGYCIARAYVMGLNATVGTFTQNASLQEYCQRFIGRFYDFVTYLSDLCLLTWLPKGHPVLKGSFIMLSFIFAGYLFYKSKQKKILSFIGLTISILSWPIILVHYQPRYIYILLPLTLLFLAIAWQQAALPATTKKAIKRYSTYPLYSLIVFQAFFLFKTLQQREYVFGATTKAFKGLVEHPLIKNKKHSQPLALVGLPDHWFAMANAQAIWLLSNNNSFPVYEFGPKVNLAWQKNYLDKPFNKDSVIRLQETENGFVFISSNPEKVTFDNKMAQTTCIIPKPYVDEKPLVITWDYQQGEFIVVKNFNT